MIEIHKARVVRVDYGCENLPHARWVVSDFEGHTEPFGNKTIAMTQAHNLAAIPRGRPVRWDAVKGFVEAEATKGGNEVN